MRKPGSVRALEDLGRVRLSQSFFMRDFPHSEIAEFQGVPNTVRTDGMKRTRFTEAGIEPSVGGVGGSYDNALAETVIGLLKTEVIHRRGPWRSFEAVEFAALEMGRLVQHPSSARADWKHPTGRGRSRIPRPA